jgi:hypothetical protein
MLATDVLVVLSLFEELLACSRCRAYIHENVALILNGSAELSMQQIEDVVVMLYTRHRDEGHPDV